MRGINMGPVLDAIADTGASHEGSGFCEGDYWDSDGLLVCGKCGGKKQFHLVEDLGGSVYDRVVPAICKCKLPVDLQSEKAKQIKHYWRVSELRKDGKLDGQYSGFTFENDDGRNPKESELCQRYADNWTEVARENIGMLLFGDCGAGKTFMACCIANALIEKYVSVYVTSFPRILDEIQSSFRGKGRGAAEIIASFENYSLLVIDDLGAERDTSFSYEQAYSVIDARKNAGKPLIMTTNLLPSAMRKETDFSRKRVFDRVLETCPVEVHIKGVSRRGEIAKAKASRAFEILGYTKPGAG